MDTIDTSIDGGVAVVRLNRPPVNAVNRQMQLELTEQFRALSVDRTVAAVVLAATGERAFCGGIDLKETAAGLADDTTLPTQATLDPGWEWRTTQEAIRYCAVPVIAAVDGPAIGAGIGLVGVCDLIVASERATFGLTEINVGLLGGASKMLRMVGPFMARRMLFFGELHSAAELYRFGGIEAVVPPGEAEQRAVELARKLTSKSPLALRLAKESVLRIEGREMEDRYRTEQDYTNRLRGFNDSAEAMAAFLERRQPTWTWS
ncbi:MAG TPA: enoyl-CoA hydratase-related protein [Ilumatobacter sp.]|nr:enoyl-CoA hydratase-related protein [Ilumatobacter sp.]